MRCQCCHKNPATIRIYDVQDWRTKSLHMVCDACAKFVLPQFMLQGEPLPKGEQAIERAQDMLEIQVDDLSDTLLSESMQDDDLDVTLTPGPCPECGWSFEDFKNRGRLGCPACYETFKEPLDHILERIHAMVEPHHVGRQPGEVAPDSRVLQRQRLREKKREMELAVETEDYERAAELRDQIKSMEEALHSPSAASDGGDAPPSLG